jgi:uncharacterized DUF497 family protein
MFHAVERAAKFTWDEAKRAANLKAHGVDFAEVESFDWDDAIVADDIRRAYGERRQIAVGSIGDRLHVCVFTDRGAARRIISLRKANRREIRAYLGE